MSQQDSMRGRVCIVTGASSGIGFVTARELARRGAQVSILCRNPEKGERTREAVRAVANDAPVGLFLADLGSQAEIRRVAEEILAQHDEIHVLLNNAGVTELKRSTTSDGIETVFAVNHLAYFLLTRLLLDRLLASGRSRVVNVASEGHRFGRIDFDDLGWEQRRYKWMRVYGQSKLANILFTYELARHIAGRDATANCLHPGAVATGLGSASSPRLHRFVMRFGRPFFRTPEQGAETSLYLASSPEVEGLSGGYYKDCRAIESSPLSRDESLAGRLWQVSGQLTGLAPG